MERKENFVGEPGNVPAVPATVNGVRETVARQARELARSAAELGQLALLDETPFEEAFVLSVEEVRKRYTAENSRQIEWRRDACVKLLARQCSAEDIGDILHMNPRTVAAIAGQESQKIAGISEQFSEALVGSAASDLALAETKKHAASYKDLHIGAGIKLTHAMAFKMVGAGAGDPSEGALDMEAENPALVKARKFLEQRQQVKMMEAQ